MNSPRSKLRGITLASPKNVWRHSSPLQAAEYSAVNTIKGFDVGLSRSLPVSIGERLLIRANLKEHKLFNGNIVEVAGIQNDGTLVLTDKRIRKGGRVGVDKLPPHRYWQDIGCSEET